MNAPIFPLNQDSCIRDPGSNVYPFNEIAKHLNGNKFSDTEVL